MHVEPQTSLQAWKLIEQDYTLRLSLVASEWSEEHLKARNAVFLEGRKRGNPAYWGPALVATEIADEDKRAEWAYRTCGEIWDIQGRPRCRPFFRAIFEACLQPMFAIRGGSFTHQLEVHQEPTAIMAAHYLATINGHMRREREKLRAKWNTKLEIATRDSEYQRQLLPSAGPQQVGPKQPEIADLQLKPGRTNLTKNKTKNQLKKMGVAFGVIQLGFKAAKYCVALDERRVRPPDHWIEEGCPSSYAQAYKDPKWRKRIQDEKSRYRELYESSSFHEREDIIQCKTRHSPHSTLTSVSEGPSSRVNKA